MIRSNASYLSKNYKGNTEGYCSHASTVSYPIRGNKQMSWFRKMASLYCKEAWTWGGGKLFVFFLCRKKIMVPLARIKTTPWRTPFGTSRNSSNEVLKQKLFLWSNLDKDILFKLSNMKVTYSAHYILYWDIPEERSRLHICYAGPFKGHVFFTIDDAYSKRMDVTSPITAPMKDWA